jgi:hypothetical protein
MVGRKSVQVTPYGVPITGICTIFSNWLVSDKEGTLYYSDDDGFSYNRIYQSDPTDSSILNPEWTSIGNFNSLCFVVCGNNRIFLVSLDGKFIHQVPLPQDLTDLNLITTTNYPKWEFINWVDNPFNISGSTQMVLVRSSMSSDFATYPTRPSVFALVMPYTVGGGEDNLKNVFLKEVVKLSEFEEDNQYGHISYCVTDYVDLVILTQYGVNIIDNIEKVLKGTETPNRIKVYISDWQNLSPRPQGVFWIGTNSGSSYSYIFLAYKNKLWVSTDGGRIWSSMMDTASENSFEALCGYYDSGYDNTVILGKNYGSNVGKVLYFQGVTPISVIESITLDGPNTEVALSNIDKYIY